MIKEHNRNTLFFSKNVNLREEHNEESKESYKKLFDYLKEHGPHLVLNNDFTAEVTFNISDLVNPCEDCEEYEIMVNVAKILNDDFKIVIQALSIDNDMITIAFIDQEKINKDLQNEIDQETLSRNVIERDNLNNIVLMAQENGDILTDTTIEYHKILVEQGKNIDPEVSMNQVEE